MRLDFNVLWVDDQPDRVLAQIRSIKRRMAEDGFEFKPIQCQTLVEVNAHLAEDVFTDEVDLILVDWDLGQGIHGQEAIRDVREAIPYKDVVFYSANTGVDELRRFAFEGDLEGVYCATRDGLVEEVLGVFESLVKKVLDLDHTRGIVMGATSDIDNMVRDCLSALHDGLDDEGRKSMIKAALQRIGERVKDLNKKVSRLQDEATLQAILEAHFIFSANDGLRILSRLLDTEPVKAQHGNYRTAVVEYMERVVQDRNILGHQILTPEGRPVAVAAGDGKEIRLDEMRELRCRLLDLRTEFRGLLRALRP